MSMIMTSSENKSGQRDDVQNPDENDAIFVPCKLCDMYRHMDRRQYEPLKQLCTRSNKPVSIECISCQEKQLLLAQIQDLNDTIFNLNERVASLIHIREEENCLDTTVENLVHDLKHLHLNLNGDDVPEAVLEEVVQAANSANDGNPSDTTVWSESEVEVSNEPSANTPVVTDTTSNPDTVSDNTNTIGNIETASKEKAHGQVNNDLKRTSVPNPVIDKNIKVILAGDKTFNLIQLASSNLNSEKCLKIAPVNTHVEQLIENIDFFVEKMQDNPNSVVLQVSTLDCIHGRTEVIKQRINDFAEALYNRGMSLVLSGPVPYPSLSNGAFSRAWAINQWLIDFCDAYELPLVDNFIFLKKSGNENYFFRNGRGLNQRGSDMIGKAITEHLTLLQSS